MAEALDRSGTPYLTTGFNHGSFHESRMGIPPSTLLDIRLERDRKTVFYNGIAQLAGPEGAYTNYWRPGGVMSSLQSEFSVAIENARVSGVAIPDTVKDTYDQKIIAFGSCMGLSSGIQHCDGGMNILAEQIMPQEHELTKGWDKTKSDLMLADPAVAFPLEWIRQHAESGTLPYFWSKQKIDPTSVPGYLKKLAGAMETDPAWRAVKLANSIPDGLENSLTKIAYAYFVAEDLPTFQEKIKNGTVHFTDARAPAANPDASDCGFLPFDNVFYATLKDPTGILRFKQIFPNNPEIIEDIRKFFTAADGHFAGRLMDKKPSELSVKDLKRFGKVWDLLVGGSQGSSLADFSKFGEAIFALNNMYNMAGLAATNRADIVGWMVGEALYFKTCALMSGIDNGEKLAQLFRVLSLGNMDTPDELARVSAGVLGAQGAGFLGAMQIIQQFGLHVGSEHYLDAIAMIKSGEKDPKKARVMQKVMVVGAAVNRLSGAGKRK